MKKVLTFMMALIMVMSIAIAAIPASAAEVVMPNEDWHADKEGIYRISSAADMLAFSAMAAVEGNYKDKVVKLTNDIDMAGVEWFMLAEFHGTFDGNGYAIKNLTMSTSAFIRKMMDGAVMRNVRFENAKNSLPAAGDCAIVALSITGSVTFENVYVQGEVSIPSDKARVAGFVSLQNGGSLATFTNCVSNVTIKSGQRAGGFLAQNNPDSNTVFNDCVFMGDMSASEVGQWSACFAGLNVGSLEMNRCAALGKAPTHKESGVLFFSDHQNNDKTPGSNCKIKVNDCYAATDGKYAIGAQPKRSFYYTLTVSYDGAEVLNYEATTQDTNFANNMETIDKVMRYFVKGDTVNMTKDNFKALYSALSKDDKWVACGTETVEFATGKTVALVMPAVVKNLIDGKSTVQMPYDETVDYNKGNEGEGENNGEGKNNGDSGNQNEEANTTAAATTATPAVTTAPSVTTATATKKAEEKSGCGSVIASSAVILLAATCGVAMITRKKEND